MPFIRFFALIFSLSTLANPLKAELLDCITVPNRLVDVAFGASGIVAEVTVERGRTVQKGELLARLDTSVEDAAIEIARARLAETASLNGARQQLELAERQLERSRGLAAKQATTAIRMEEAQSAQIAGLRAVREQLELKTIQKLDLRRLEAVRTLRMLHSPINGVVVDRHVQPAEYVENRRVLSLAEIDPIAIDVIAPARLFGKVAPGGSAMVRLGMPRDRQVEARIEVVDPYVDGASSTFRIRLHAPNADLSIVAGFTCRIEIGEPAR